MWIFLAVMIVKRGSELPKGITSLDIFKKRVKKDCQDKFRYHWSCFRVEGGTKWPLQDPSRPIFFDSLSFSGYWIYPLSLFLIPFLNLLFKYKNKALIRTKLFLKACCWIVNLDIPPTAVLCNSFMFFKCYFIASVLKSCSHGCQPYHAWPLVCDLVLSGLVC